MADVGSVLVPVTISAVVNGISKFRTEGPMGAFQVVFANAALFTMLAGIGQFIDWRIASTLGVLYLIATMFTAGVPFIDWVSALVGGPTTGKVRTNG